MRFLLAFLALVAAVPAFAQSPTVAEASSPSNVLKLTVTLNGEGRIGYAVSRGATPVIAESHLGFLLTDGPQLLRNFELRDTARRSVDEDRKSTRLNSSHTDISRMPSSA